MCFLMRLLDSKTHRFGINSIISSVMLPLQSSINWKPITDVFLQTVSDLVKPSLPSLSLSIMRIATSLYWCSAPRNSMRTGIPIRVTIKTTR